MTRIFLDSGDPAETREALSILGFLDGQTTNPSLIAKNPAAQNKKFSKKEIVDFYRKVIEEVSSLISQGSVSIEVYADASTPAQEMLNQGREFFQWIPNAHIKFPTTAEGLKAAEAAVREGMRVNMTLVFSQGQAAAVYAATKGAKKGGVFLSPFVGRLDDRGENGMDLIANIVRMYGQGDGHVEVLTASVRSLNHLLQAIALGSDIITAPLKILKEWASLNFPSPFEGRVADLPSVASAKGEGQERLQPIPYQPINLNKPWRDYDIHHELTDKGVEKFAADWNNLIENGL
jgi:transaldolase